MFPDGKITARRAARYYWRIIKRSLYDTLALANRQGLIAALILASIGFFFLRTWGPEEARGEALRAFVLSAAIPIAAMAVLAFFWNLVLAPVRLERDQEKAHFGELVEREELVSKLSAQVERFTHPEPRIVFKDRLAYQARAAWDFLRGTSVDYDHPEEIAHETWQFLKESVGTSEAEVYAAWVWDRGDSKKPNLAGGAVYVLEKLQERADEVALRSNFDAQKWSSPGPVDLPPRYRV